MKWLGVPIVCGLMFLVWLSHVTPPIPKQVCEEYGQPRDHWVRFGAGSKGIFVRHTQSDCVKWRETGAKR